MKKILLSLLFCSTAFAELPSIRNDSCSTVLNGTNGLPGYMCVDSTGKLSMSIPASATSIAKNEDAAAASGDTGAFVLGVANEAKSNLASNDGDYTPLAVTRAGVLYSNINIGSIPSADIANSILKSEDATIASGDAGVAMLNQRLDQLATGQTGGNNEYAVPIVDTLSRQYVNAWGAAVTEFFSSCSSSITGTSRTAIKAAVASNRIYVSSITCKNTSAVNSGMDFTDGAGTQLAAGHITAQTVSGAWTATFPTPLRGSSNTDFSVTMNTTSTATVCCANGFISPY